MPHGDGGKSDAPLICDLLIWSQLTFSSNFQSHSPESPIPNILRVFAVFVPNASIWFVLTAVETNFVSSSHISLPPFSTRWTIFSLPTERTSAKFSFGISGDLSSAQVPEKRFYWKDHGHDDEHAKIIEHKKYEYEIYGAVNISDPLWEQLRG